MNRFSMVVVALTLVACSGGSPPTPSPSDSPLTISPDTATVSPGDAPISLTATLTGSSGTINWSLSPTAGAGTLSATTGMGVQYTPPNQITSAQTVRLTASAGTASRSVQITLKPLAQFYTESSVGLDTNPGTQGKPLKTIKEALARMGAGATKTTVLTAGTYNEASGETWAYDFPEGVALNVNTSGVVLQSLAKKDGFKFAGSATFSDLTLTGFGTALEATTGLLTLTRLNFKSNQTDLKLSGVAASGPSASLQDCTSSGTTYSLLTYGASKLTVQNGTFNSLASGSVLGMQARGEAKFTATKISGGGLYVSEASFLSLKDVVSVGSDVFVSSYGLLEVEGGSFSNVQGNTSAIRSSGGDINVKGTRFSNNYSAIIAEGGGVSLNNIFVTNSDWTGILLRPPTSSGRLLTFRMRNSTVYASKIYGIEYDSDPTRPVGSIDLGTASDPGGNTLLNNVFRNLQVKGNTTLTAVGNTWNANIQGADAQGSYAAARVNGPQSGDNYYIGSGVSIQF
jgi:Protein of unknown function (DUF1565)